MAHIDPQQELFTALKLGIEALGYNVYDSFLPPDGTPYPFVYLGNFQQVDNNFKNAVCGFVYPTIHIWHDNPRQRGTLSGILLDVKTVCRRVAKTNNFAWDLRRLNQQILNDTTTKTPLLHGLIEAGFFFS